MVRVKFKFHFQAEGKIDLLGMLLFLFFTNSLFAGPVAVDVRLQEDNKGRENLVAGPFLDDLQYLRKLSVDLLGRIPSEREIKRYLNDSSGMRRELLVERLLGHDRFADRWTAFFADMLRIRTNATGGSQLLAYVHQSISEGKPFDELARELISAQGRSRHLPAVGFILNDNADPMALTPCIRFKEQAVPFYAHGWEQEYLEISPIDRIIKMLHGMSHLRGELEWCFSPMHSTLKCL